VSFFDKVSADSKQIGFDYQDFVCLEYLMDMKQGETVGLEVLDDVHHGMVDGTKDLVQVKHSISDGGTLTNSDIDLWKTLSNWVNAAKEIKHKALKFTFYTNKKPTSEGGIVNNLISKPVCVDTILQELSLLKAKLDEAELGKTQGASPNPIHKYVIHLSSCSADELKDVLLNIEFVFDDSEIVARLRKKIEYFAVPEAISEKVLHQVIGAYKVKKFELIKGRNRLNIDYLAFRTEFQFDRIVRLAGDREVNFSRYHNFKNINNIDPIDGVFSHQLADIGIDGAEITDFAIQYAATTMFIQDLISKGEFTDSENTVFESEVLQGWKSVFRQSYIEAIVDDPSHNRIAKACLYKTAEQSVSVSNSNVSKELVEGKSIEMSDRCKIGWRNDWQDKYKVGPQ
jgi:hypothetical protein